MGFGDFIGDVVKAPFKTAFEVVKAPFNILGDTIGGAFSGAMKGGKFALIGGAICLALAPVTGGASLAALPWVVGGSLAGGAALGGVKGFAGGTLESTGNILQPTLDIFGMDQGGQDKDYHGDPSINQAYGAAMGLPGYTMPTQYVRR